MKLVILAVVTGLAAAAGMLGAGLYPAARTSTPHLTIEQERNQPGGRISPAHPSRTSAHHGNGNRARPEYLNPNVIKGVTTTICAEDAAMHTALEPAIKVWNAALPHIAGGAVLTRHPNAYIDIAPDPFGQPVEVTVTGCRDMDVEVLWLTDQTQASQCDRNGWGARACYDAELVSTPLPRRYFLSEDNADADNMEQNYGIIYYQRTKISQATLIHELGHVLGLSDYFSCEDLRAVLDTPWGTIPPDDIDPLNDHFSLMRNNQNDICRYHGAITGRDHRDFYESYHVGAITDVRLEGHAEITPTGEFAATFRWGDTGIAEANHNASHIVVMRRAHGSTYWSQAGIGMAIRDTNGMARHSIRVFDDDGLAAEYKVVSLTRADIRRQPTLDVSGGYAVEERAGGPVIAGLFAEGDPTFVVGVAAYAESDAAPIEVDGPEVLSASISDPRYCDVNGTLKVSMRSSGGSATAVEKMKGVVGSLKEVEEMEESTEGSCGPAAGKKEFTVQAEWSSDATAVTQTISLPVYVHASPQRLNGVSARSPSASGPITACASGETVIIRPSPNTLTVSAWIDGEAHRAIPVIFTCPNRLTPEPIDILLLRADGGGARLKLEVVPPLEVDDFQRARTCTAGEQASTSFGMTGGVGPYEYSDIRGNQDNADGSNHWYRYQCPLAPNPNGDTLTIEVTDSNGRVASATVELVVSDTNSEPVPEPNPDPNPEPDPDPEPDPTPNLFTLTAWAEPTSCETGGSVYIAWSVSGGTAPYTVTVDGAVDSTSPTTVSCQSTAGSQSVSVAATDSSAPAKRQTANITLTVTAPPPAMLSASGRIDARLVSSGNVEFCYRPTGGEHICPTKRFVNPDRADRWRYSSAVRGPAGGQTDVVLGQIAVKHAATGSYLEVCFRPRGGEEICPDRNSFYYLTTPENS